LRPLAPHHGETAVGTENLGETEEKQEEKRGNRGEETEKEKRQIRDRDETEMAMTQQPHTFQCGEEKEEEM
jgi:hypothetical protein